jgi:hypothetical protein
MRRLFCGALFALTASGASGAVPDIMAVHGVRAGSEGITVRAPVQGLASCTPTRQNLTIAVSKQPDGAIVLVAPRGTAECRARGAPADVRWTYEELGLKPGQPFNMANPLAAEP